VTLPSADLLTGPEKRGAAGASRPANLRVAAAIGGLIFLAALLVRMSGFTEAFPGGTLQVPPFDDLYHALRITYSAAHFPGVLDFDPSRGPAGAWCPWPPLYDLLAGGAARLLGGTSGPGVRARAVFFPPFVFSLFAGTVATLVARRAGPAAGLVAGTAIAFSFPLWDVSRLGTLDHHFLEPPLLLALAAAFVAAVDGRRPVLARTVFLAGSLTIALFVQTSFLLAAGVGLGALLLVAHEETTPLAIGAAGFGAAAGAVFLWRAAHPPDYPATAWYLGTPHAALLAGAGATCALAAALQGHSPSLLRRLAIAVAGGGAVALSIPGTAAAFLQGARFLGGDPWLSTIAEFRPLFVGEGAAPFRELVMLGGGALLVFPFAVGAARGQRRDRIVLAVFSLAFLAASIGTRRFTVVAIPLLAIVGGLVTADAARRSRAAALGAAALTAGPALALAPIWLNLHIPVVPPEAAPMVRTARRLQALPTNGGRLLGPWSWGHLFHVAGNRPVVIDNFGAMIGRKTFDDAEAALLLRRDDGFRAYLRRNGIRYVVLQNPVIAVRSFTLCLEQPLDPWLRPKAPAGRPEPTALLRSTVWWRLYAGASPGAPAGEVPAGFRLLYADPAAAGAPPPWDGPAMVVWEFTGAPTNVSAPSGRTSATLAAKPSLSSGPPRS
jgi:asparagine N-glycosylation enzyme membrane subunit Stt3